VKDSLRGLQVDTPARPNRVVGRYRTVDSLLSFGGAPGAAHGPRIHQPLQFGCDKATIDEAVFLDIKRAQHRSRSPA
jgi:hypothetical protein